MTRKEVKKRIREEVAADQARYDDVTRRMEALIERYRKATEPQRSARRESS
jgi:hypothetical protein